GVAAGMADYFDVDPVIIRLGLVATTVLGGPTVPIVYLAAWLIIPEAGSTSPAPVAPAAPWATAPPPAPAPVPSAPAPGGPVDTVDTFDTVDTDTITQTMVEPDHQATDESTNDREDEDR
ncbi:MAG: PspC domain-containing protein, partial [Actinomycetota bacterium]